MDSFAFHKKKPGSALKAAQAVDFSLIRTPLQFLCFRQLHGSYKNRVPYFNLFVNESGLISLIKLFTL